MDKRQASITAKSIAAFRALETEKPENERLFSDPYADELTDKEGWKLALKFTLWYPYMPKFISVRTRYIDDFVKESIHKGIGQLIIFGAGFDTRSIRLEELKTGIQVFEIDEPYTSQEKQAKLLKIIGALPKHLSFLPIDLTKYTLEDLKERLLEGGYNPRQKALFIMESVLAYLTPEAVDNIFSFITQFSGRGSFVIFNYYWQEDQDMEGIKGELRKIGESPTFGLSPHDIKQFLSQRNLILLNNLSINQIKDLYYPQDQTKIEPWHYCFATAITR